jgi:hypothetical protein
MLTVVRAWILLSTLLVSAGWILSALHQLNRPGYGIFFAVAAIAFFFWQQKNHWQPWKNFPRQFHKVKKRFRRPAPALFLSLVLMTLAAALIYPQSNADANVYRIPRVLHWLGQEQWHWIRTYDLRMNIAGCGYDWLSAPIILFTRITKFLFLINWLSYLMLPGLLFSVLTRLKISPRVAWWWSWLLASGWCFVLQAATAANDCFSAVYILAAVDLALRATKNKNSGDLCLSFLAVMLLTGAKQINLALVLLWLIAAWPALKMFLAKPALSAATILAGLLVSALPTAILNYQHTRTWLGIPAADHVWKMELASPFWGIVGNAFCLPLQNLMPPIFPWTERWNGLMDSFLRTPFGAHFTSFEAFAHLSVGRHGIDDGDAGIGLAILTLVVASIFGGWKYSKALNKNMWARAFDRFWLLRITPWALLLLFMAKVGAYENARQLTPYYAFLFPILLVQPAQAVLVRKCWWQRLGLALMAVTALMVATSRTCPLFPAQTIFNFLHAEFPQSKLIVRVAFPFNSRFLENDERNFFQKNIPADETVIGVAATLAGNEKIFWLPFGPRRVQRVLAEDSPEQMRTLGIRYLVVEPNFLQIKGEDIQEYAQRSHAEVIGQFSRSIGFNLAARPVYLLRLE